MSEATSKLAGRASAATRPLIAVTAGNLKAWLAKQSPRTKAWVEASGFKAAPHSQCLIPGTKGEVACALAGIGDPADPFAYAGLPSALPKGRYRFDSEPEAGQADAAALGWALGSYAFTRYRKPSQTFAELVWPKRADRGEVTRLAEAVYLVRDLINTPAGDLGPTQLAEAAKDLAKRHGAKTKVIVGDDLLKRNYPAIHAVGRAAADAPRLIDMRWGGSGPRVTLVGKGVCFDSGGLDLKPAAGMKLMKKDMGGAAHVLGLAHAIMDAGLPLRLRVLIPAVENAVSGNAFRPLDVLSTRKGLTVEIGHTDAEGRLILCDALTEAQSESPDLIVDFATLTGAARVALGPELPAMFCNHDPTAEALERHAAEQGDPLWRLPLHQAYKSQIDSKVADLNNVSSQPFAGAIIAALFLERFVEPKTPWVHFDIMAWNPSGKPGRPEGGEAMGLRAVLALIKERVGFAESAGKA